jgi:hypothetical protein
MSVVLPDMPPDAESPSGWRLMLAIIQKSSDPDWVAEMVGHDRHALNTMGVAEAPIAPTTRSL